VKGIDPPAELWDLEPARIVGVTLKPELLAAIRERRVRQMRGSARSYADLEDVYEELDQAEDSAVRANRLRLLLDVRDTVGRLGDFSQLPL